MDQPDQVRQLREHSEQLAHRGPMGKRPLRSANPHPNSHSFLSTFNPTMNIIKLIKKQPNQVIKK
ncbi:hypothetical protein CSV72_16155 [Sporosarcina sp. P20a]|nr:hypothetical protein CSV72_16155 [Sporosarcina sp. P20a]